MVVHYTVYLFCVDELFTFHPPGTHPVLLLHDYMPESGRCQQASTQQPGMPVLTVLAYFIT
jgi:hypothetical protein